MSSKGRTPSGQLGNLGSNPNRTKRGRFNEEGGASIPLSFMLIPTKQFPIRRVKPRPIPIRLLGIAAKRKPRRYLRGACSLLTRLAVELRTSTVWANDEATGPLLKHRRQHRAKPTESVSHEVGYLRGVNAPDIGPSYRTRLAVEPPWSVA